MNSSRGVRSGERDGSSRSAWLGRWRKRAHRFCMSRSFCASGLLAEARNLDFRKWDPTCWKMVHPAHPFPPPPPDEQDIAELEYLLTLAKRQRSRDALSAALDAVKAEKAAETGSGQRPKACVFDYHFLSARAESALHKNVHALLTQSLTC